MATSHRMFQVIVLGGIGLASAPVTGVLGCGGATTVLPPGGTKEGGTEDAFPSEGPAPLVDSGYDAFPQETATILDSGRDANYPDSFPQEGPAYVDAGPDVNEAGEPADGFPQETAAP